MHSGRIRILALLFLVTLAAALARAQDNYEIQVYASELVPPRTTMVEIHSNFTVNGSKTVVDGVQPTHHAMHETLEITQGFTDWFETGFYVFSTIQPDGGWQWVGDHLRPRVAIPEKWHWPVGLSLSQEFGYSQAKFSGDTWTYELRPIIDKTIGPWYLGFNPVFGRALHGPSVTKGWEFSPNVKVSYDVTKKVAAGIEYYGNLGPATEFELRDQQEHQIFPTIDLNLSPKWEFNFGVGWGLTPATEHLIVKCIIGRRFSWTRSKSAKLKLPKGESIGSR
ncbi:MAG TPA: hypothetical protein VK466_17440 [Terriglobales bacterium]|nr:hypothetical protein [Terriglobales bacterium]